MAKIRQYLYEALEAPSHRALGGLAIGRFLAVLIVASLASTVFETVPDLKERFGRVFDAIEALSLVVFSVEYCLRLWVAPEHVPYRHLSAYGARRAFVLSPQGIVDLVAIVPFWIALAGWGDLRIEFFGCSNSPAIRLACGHFLMSCGVSGALWSDVLPS